MHLTEVIHPLVPFSLNPLPFSNDATLIGRVFLEEGVASVLRLHQ